MWIQTYTGAKFNLDNPNAADVNIIDIAHALSSITRFTGHTKYPYSVAQHSVCVAEEVAKLGGDADEQLYGLMHDAMEAYTGDLSRPLKEVLNDRAEGVIKAIENNIQMAICQQFGLKYNPYNIPGKVKEADEIMLAIERRDLLPSHVEWGIKLPDVSGNRRKFLKGVTMGQDTAKKFFLVMFKELLMKMQSTEEK